MGETDFVEIALRPFGNAKAEMADLVTTRTIDARELDQKMLSESRVVVLANVSQLNDVQLKALENFVREEVAASGVPRQPDQQRVVQHHADGERRAPAAARHVALGLDQLRDAGDDRLAALRASRAGDVQRPAQRQPLGGGHPPLVRMREDSSRTGDTGILVLARLDTGDPFLVEKRFGDGRVLSCAVPCDAEWTNLPARPFFLRSCSSW